MKDLEKLEADNLRYKTALERIAKWFDEFPRVTDEKNGTTMSYGAAYGSNGERDYMRQIATEALEKK